jgi:hypothetical protein
VALGSGGDDFGPRRWDSGVELEDGLTGRWGEGWRTSDSGAAGDGVAPRVADDKQLNEERGRGR